MSFHSHPSCGRLLRCATAVASLAALPKWTAAAPASTEVTARLARYMVSARDQALPPEVLTACKHRILDTLGAMVSGAVAYVRGLGGTEPASVVASKLRTSAANAALANAMCAQPDETGDFEPVTKAHPGCSVVLWMA